MNETLFTIANIAKSRGMLAYLDTIKIGTAKRKLGIVPAKKIGAAYLYTQAQVDLIGAELDRIAGKS